MKKLLNTLIICGFLLHSVAQAQTSVSKSQAPDRPRNYDESLHYEGWTREKLMGNNAPFAVTRKALNQFLKVKTLQIKMNSFREEAQAKPYDARIQFRQVYGEWLLYDYDPKRLYKWRDALERPQSPKAYDYTRLRFIINAAIATNSGKWSGDSRLKEVGERLSRMKPKDKFVSYWLTEIRSNTNSVADKWVNIRQARADVKAKPKDAQAQGVLAGAYMDLWLHTKKRSHAQWAVAYYRKYLQIAPKNEPFRRHAEFWASTIMKDQATFEKKGLGTAG